MQSMSPWDFFDMQIGSANKGGREEFLFQYKTISKVVLSWKLVKEKKRTAVISKHFLLNSPVSRHKIKCCTVFCSDFTGAVVALLEQPEQLFVAVEQLWMWICTTHDTLKTPAAASHGNSSSVFSSSLLLSYFELLPSSSPPLLLSYFELLPSSSPLSSSPSLFSPNIMTPAYWPAVISLMGCKRKVSVSIIHYHHKSNYMILVYVDYHGSPTHAEWHIYCCI